MCETKSAKQQEERSEFNLESYIHEDSIADEARKAKQDVHTDKSSSLTGHVPVKEAKQELKPEDLADAYESVGIKLASNAGKREKALNAAKKRRDEQADLAKEKKKFEDGAKDRKTERDAWTKNERIKNFDHMLKTLRGYLEESKKSPYAVFMKNYAAIKQELSLIPEYEQYVTEHLTKISEIPGGWEAEKENIRDAQAMLRSLQDIGTYFGYVEAIIQNKYFAYIPMEEMDKLSAEELRKRLTEEFDLPKKPEKEEGSEKKKYRNEELIAFYQNLILLKETDFAKGVAFRERFEAHRKAIITEQKAQPEEKKKAPEQEEGSPEQKKARQEYYLKELKRITASFENLQVFLRDSYRLIGEEDCLEHFIRAFRVKECLKGFKDAGGTDAVLFAKVKKILDDLAERKKQRGEKEEKVDDVDDGEEDKGSSTTGERAHKKSELSEEQQEAVQAAGAYLMERCLEESKGAYVTELKLYPVGASFAYGAPGGSFSANQPIGRFPLRSEWKNHVPFVFEMLNRNPEQLLIAYYLLEHDRQDDATGIDFQAVRENYRPDLEKLKANMDWGKLSRALRSSVIISGWFSEYDAATRSLAELDTEMKRLKPDSQAASDDKNAEKSERAEAIVTAAAEEVSEKAAAARSAEKSEEAKIREAAEGEDKEEIAEKEEKKEEIAEEAAVPAVMEEAEKRKAAETGTPAPVIAHIERSSFQGEVVRTIEGMENAYEQQKHNNCFCCAGTAMLNQFIAKRKKQNGEGDGTIVRLVNQDHMRACRPAVRKFQAISALVSQGEYDEALRDLDRYAGEDRTEVGSIFEQGDFILDQLERQGIRDVTLHNASLSIPPDGELFDKMKQKFIEKVKTILRTDCVIGCLRSGHYTTIAGIDEAKNTLLVYNSTSEKNPEERNLDDFLQGITGGTLELEWLAEDKPEALQADFPQLTIEEGKYSIDEKGMDPFAMNRSHHFMIMQPKGLTATRIERVQAAQEDKKGEKAETVIFESVYVRQADPSPETVRLDEAMEGVKQRNPKWYMAGLLASSICERMRLVGLLFRNAGIHPEMSPELIRDPGLRKRIIEESRELRVQEIQLRLLAAEEIAQGKGKESFAQTEVGKLDAEKKKPKEKPARVLDHHVEEESGLEIAETAVSGTKEFVGDLLMDGTMKTIEAGEEMFRFAGTSAYAGVAAGVGTVLPLVTLTAGILETISLARESGLTGADWTAKITSLAGEYLEGIGGVINSAGSIMSLTAQSLGTAAALTTAGGALAVGAGAAMAIASAVQMGREVSAGKELPDWKKLGDDPQGDGEILARFLKHEEGEIGRRELSAGAGIVTGCMLSIAGGLSMTGVLAPVGAMMGVTALMIGAGAKIIDWVAKRENRDDAVDEYLGTKKEAAVKKALQSPDIEGYQETLVRARDLLLAKQGFSSTKECYRYICFQYATLLYRKVFIEVPPKKEEKEMYENAMRSLGMKMNDRQAVQNGEKPIPSIEAMVTRLMG